MMKTLKQLLTKRKTPLRLRERHRRQSGFLTTDMLLGLILLSGVFSLLHDASEYYKAKASASRAGEDLAFTLDGVTQYFRDSTNFETALSAAQANGNRMTEIDFADVIAGGFLPSGAADFNNFGQEYKIFARNPTAHPDGLEVILITEGGTAIPSRFINDAAVYAGVSGGYIGGNGYLAEEGKAEGSSGWTVDVETNYPDAVPSGGADEMTGRMAALVWFNGQGGVGDFLARMPSSDNEANTMRTDLLMGNNNLLGANIVSVEDVVIRAKTYQGAAKTASEAVHDVFIATGNQLIDKPVCPSPMVPKIYTAISKFESTTGSGAVMSGTQSYAEDVSSTQWRVKIQVLSEDDRTWTDATNISRASATVIIKCGIA